jgi:hypothetical protein
MIPSTTLVDKKHLGVGIGVFVVQASPCPRLMEARPDTKTNTSKTILFILLPFRSLSLHTQGTVNIFVPHTVRSFVHSSTLAEEPVLRPCWCNSYVNGKE